MASPSNEPPMSELLVSALDAIANGIYRIELVDPNGDNLPEFTPGAHVRIETPSGQMRHYSLCNDPAERDVDLAGIAGADDRQPAA